MTESWDSNSTPPLPITVVLVMFIESSVIEFCGFKFFYHIVGSTEAAIMTQLLLMNQIVLRFQRVVFNPNSWTEQTPGTC